MRIIHHVSAPCPPSHIRCSNYDTFPNSVIIVREIWYRGSLGENQRFLKTCIKLSDVLVQPHCKQSLRVGFVLMQRFHDTSVPSSDKENTQQERKQTRVVWIVYQTSRSETNASRCGITSRVETSFETHSGDSDV